MELFCAMGGKKGDKSRKINTASRNSKPTRNENFLNYFLQTLSTSFTSRVLIYFLVGIGAAPLGLIASFIVACGLIATLLFLPILIVPLCFSLYVTFLAYVAWKFVSASYQLMNSLEASTKELFRSSMEWLYKKTQRIPFSSSSGVALAKRFEGDEDESFDQESFEESLSSEDHEEARNDVPELKVRSPLHISRPRFYRIDSVKKEETVTVGHASSSQANKTNKVSIHQQCLHVKNGVQSQDVGEVKSFQSDKSAMTEKLEEMRRLLSTVRRRVNGQHPVNPIHSTNGQS